MRVMGNVEYACVVNELQYLVGKRFSKFKRLNDDTFVFGIGDTILLAQLGVRLHVTKYVQQTESEGGFATIVKALLKNQKLKNLYLYNKDRVILFEFDSKLLIFEMFGKGNVILVDGGITIAAHKEESWSDRTIKRKVGYTFPKSNLKHNLKEALSDRYVVSALLSLPLGKEYAKEILFRCNLPEKKAGNTLNNDEIDRVEKEISTIESSLSPKVFYDQGKVIDYGFTNFTQYAHCESKDFQSFNEALDFFYWNYQEKETEHLLKLRARTELQKKTLEDLRIQEKEAKECGDFIYSHYTEVEEILIRAKKMRIDETEDAFKKHGAKINKKEKEIELELCPSN